MITSKTELKAFIKYEDEQYRKYMYPTRSRRFFGNVKSEPVISIMRWQANSRKADYYKYRKSHGGSFVDKIAYLFYTRRRNRLGRKLGIEAETFNVGKGLLVFHHAGGIVLNGSTKIGEHCHLHGNNYIGNSGKVLDCPVLGDNIMLGVGAKVIGNVRVANNVKIAAGAVVVKDVLEEGCTVGGIPAKEISTKP